MHAKRRFNFAKPAAPKEPETKTPRIVEVLLVATLVAAYVIGVAYIYEARASHIELVCQEGC